jgi:asparaginyl-tRNA synthetase
MIKAPNLRNDHNGFLTAIQEPWYRVLLDLQNEISYATFEFYKKEGLKTIYLPITTTSVSSPMGLGSDSFPVEINICGIDTYLADSMQFFLEYGCRFLEKGCFYIMPSFRGEQADKRHLCQFFHSEAEIIGDQQDVISLVERYIKFVTEKLLSACEEQILKVAGTISHMEKFCLLKEIPQIEYRDAIIRLKHIEGALKKENDLIFVTSIGEKALMDEHDGFVWLSNMDRKIVPFYQASCDREPEYAKCSDLLFGIGEVVGSGERCKTAQDVLLSMANHGVNPEPYKWYITMKEQYPLHTSGFGMGIERFLLWVLKHDDIRDCQLILRQNGVRDTI